MNKKSLGQFFTENIDIQKELVSLIKNRGGNLLEPSAGSGELLNIAIKLNQHKKTVGWELDSTIQKIDPNLPIIYGDFFALSETTEKFQTIIGNPPFVAWKDALITTKTVAKKTNLNYGGKSNLYYLFIDKCVDLLEDKGELIFIVPKEWIYLTTTKFLRNKLLTEGRITHFIDVGEEKVFKDASVPALMIFRFQKGGDNKTNKIKYKKFLEPNFQKRYLISDNDFWKINENKNSENSNPKIGDLFDVSVGLVSGADKIFDVTNSEFEEEFSKENTTISVLTTAGLKTYLFVENYSNFENIPPKTRNYLQQNKKLLLCRKIRHFNETNFWKYGAIRNLKIMNLPTRKIYVPARTRNNKPFFFSDETNFFGGGILSLTPKQEIMNLEAVLDALNSPMFRKQCEQSGLTTGNKVSFQPRTLQQLELPIIPTIKKTTVIHPTLF